MDGLDSIRPLQAAYLQPALDLVWEVFQEFEAPDYAPEGVEEFREFLRPENIQAKITEGLRFWGYFEGDRLVGVMAVRPVAHLTLLFVHPDFHRRGIARRLLGAALRQYPGAVITVHASPYGLEAYQRLGFVSTAPEQVENGIRYIPMKRMPREGDCG